MKRIRDMESDEIISSLLRSRGLNEQDATLRQAFPAGLIDKFKNGDIAALMKWYGYGSLMRELLRLRFEVKR